MKPVYFGEEEKYHYLFVVAHTLLSAAETPDSCFTATLVVETTFASSTGSTFVAFGAGAAGAAAGGAGTAVPVGDHAVPTQSFSHPSLFSIRRDDDDDDDDDEEVNDGRRHAVSRASRLTSGHGPSSGSCSRPPLAHRGQRLPCSTRPTCSAYFKSGGSRWFR